MLTDMERKVFRVVVVESYHDAGASVTEISENTGISPQKVRGVLSSLIKKDLIDTWADDGKVTTFLPINDEGEAVCFGLDKYTEQEYSKMFYGVDSLEEIHQY